MNKNNYFCVILAGGKGRRLWPCSREQYPKQFLDFFGLGRTLIQQTYDRFSKILPPENIFISTNQNYYDIVREQLPQLSEQQILPEPIFRNTAPSVAWATHRIKQINPTASIVMTPSDQIIQNEEAFDKDMLEALEFVTKHEGILSIGIRPTRPEPGYGYIQIGEKTKENLFEVKSFTEKPEREFAKIFMESGEFLWNTGLFLGTVQSLSKCFTKALPVVLRQLDATCPKCSIEQENEFIRENFPLYPNMSIDHGVLEKFDNVYVMKCNFGWADIGTWHSIYEAKQKMEQDNVIIDSDVIIDNSHNNVIKLPKDKLAVINGLEDSIVAEEGNVLLICKKEDSSALIRKYISEVQIKKGEDYI